MTNYELSYIELYNTSRHGELDDLPVAKQKHIQCNYLLMHSIKPEMFLKYPAKVTKIIDKTKIYYEKTIQQNDSEYKFRDNHASLEIIKRVNNDEYTFAIVKTFWLKLFQRRWKKIYQNKQHIMKKMMNSQNLMHREIHGKLSFNTNIYHI